jgi:dolichyl-phosphate beta-glucosyltransferase
MESTGRTAEMRHSIVIPALNEELRIVKTLQALREIFDDAEIIVVDDGSADGTSKVASALGARVIRHERNRGKGAAVRTGFAQAMGDVIGFLDADGSTDPHDAKAVFEAAQEHDIAIASRSMRGAVITQAQPPYRKAAGIMLRFIVRVVLGLNILDTQCGCKALKRKVAEDIIPRMKSEGFDFDIELLYLAKKAGYDVYEMPVRWTDERETKVNTVRDGLRMFGGVLALRLRG